GVIHEVAGARLSQQCVVRVERRADCSAAVSGGGLDVELLDRRFADDSPVGDAVQRHAASQAPPLEAPLPVDRTDPLHAERFRNLLDAGGDVGVMLVVAYELGEVARLRAEVAGVARARRKEVDAGLSWRAEEVDELLTVRGVTRVVVREVIHVETEGPVTGHL